MAAGALRVEVEAGVELAEGLKGARKDAHKAIRASNRAVARSVRDWTRAAAGRGTARERRMAGGIGSSAATSNARLTVRNTARAPAAQATFWGAKRHTGWYAAGRYSDAAGRQHPQWVGASWTVARRGEGPFVINPTLADRADDIGRMYLDGQWEALERALPRARVARLR